MLVHQTNCSSTRVAGLASNVFSHYPCANTYINWHSKRKLGCCDVFDVRSYGTPVEYVVNMNAQTFPGKPNARENHLMRQQKFSECLLELQGLVATHKWKRVNFPYRIGCGLAGGNWDMYLEMIQRFAESVDIDVYIVMPNN